MYETFFRFSGKPFQLNPDPAFFYGSRGHRRAMVILAPLLDSEGLGAAIRDRLLRAAEGKVFHVGQPTSHEA